MLDNVAITLRRDELVLLDVMMARPFANLGVIDPCCPGIHRSKGGEGEQLRDCRRHPIRFEGYSISYRRAGVTPAGGPAPKWHAHVRIDDTTYRQLKAHFVDLATHRTADTLGREFGRIPFARYAPVRRQLLNILRAVNERRKQQNFELLPHSVLKLKRAPVPVYVRTESDVPPIAAPAEAA